jgi:tetratricopeptide (TPR) repeat protein
MQDIQDKINLAYDRLRAGRLLEAGAIASRLIRQQPDDLATLVLAATIADQQNKINEGDFFWAKAQKAGAYDPNVWIACGLSRLGARRLDAALDCFTRVLELAPSYGPGHSNLGNLLDEMGKTRAALEAYCRAIVLDPGDGLAQTNASSTLLTLGLPIAAIRLAAHGCHAAPGLADAHYNLGYAYHRTNQDQLALPAYQRAIDLGPQVAKFHFNQALSLLRAGQYAQGWKAFDWRHRMVPPVTDIRQFSIPQWQGEALGQRRLLVHAEQGLGDTIQFARYVQHLRDQGIKVVFLVKKGLGRLISQWLNIAIIEDGDPIPTTDLHCPIMSLPQFVCTDPKSLPWTPYSPDAVDIARWQSRPGTSRDLRIGLVMAGRPTHGNDANRSMAPDMLGNLFDIPGVSFHLLQDRLRPMDESALARYPSIHRHDHQIADFTDTAAMIALMDVVISVDTSVAHLAGTMAKPTWIMLPYWSDWRWGLDRADSDWYPSVRLFRQSAPGDWTQVIAEIRTQILATIAARSIST